MVSRWESEQKRGKFLAGLALILVGGAFLGREFGLEIPHWLLTWKMLLVGIGVFSAIKSGYRSTFWVFPLLVGSGFLLADFYPELVNKRIIWPIVLIVVGLVIMLKPRRKSHWNKLKARMANMSEGSRGFGSERDCQIPSEPVSGSSLEFTAFLGGISKTIISKDFVKGEINAVLGGAEINFSQADIADRAFLEINAILGGVKIIVPANWEIKSEINCVLGGVEDKRVLKSGNPESPLKVLTLEGNAIMGGIEIKSY